MSNQLLRLNAFRGEPASSGFEYHLSTNLASSVPRDHKGNSPSFRLLVSVSAQQSAFAVGVLSDLYREIFRNGRKPDGANSQMFLLFFSLAQLVGNWYHRTGFECLMIKSNSHLLWLLFFFKGASVEYCVWFEELRKRLVEELKQELTTESNARRYAYNSMCKKWGARMLKLFDRVDDPLKNSAEIRVEAIDKVP
ncbi:hypothetical protein RND71_006152 [Anisodus tanguticus]|uniref:Uncharacterized protein n=1 Tax=Anisodus tanguticus TaxID=243964 RepID=A0AAE1VVZ7_9SOLA|nr:hypothetical protein RND71_006152 [Anisodus tanguticus]